MEKENCYACRWLEEFHDIGLICNKWYTKIYAVNAEKKNVLCNHFKPKTLAIVRHSRKSKYRSLNQCFEALGAPHEYCYVNIKKPKKVPKGHYGLRTIYRREDGSNKYPYEIEADLKKYYKAAIREYHPDANPYTERLYYDEASKEINAAAQQAQRILQYRFPAYRFRKF